MLIRLLLAAFSGVMMVLLFPPYGFALLAPIALTPLIVALGGEFRPRARFLLGYVTGILFWAGVCWWIAPVLAVHGAMGEFGGWGSFALFCILKAIHYGVFGLVAGVLVRHWFGPPTIALLWAVLERTQEPLTLFGWLMLGDAAIDMQAPLRLAPFTGVHGLSFLFMVTAGSFAAVLLRQPRQRALWLLLTVVPMVLPELPRERASAHAALVQPNLDPLVDWNADTYLAAKQTMQAETMRALREGPVELVVWPETPGPIYYEVDRDLQTRVREVITAAGVPVILGAIWRGGGSEPRNSAQLVPRGAGEAVRYDKMFLVPFGEYVPSLFSFVNQVTDEAGAYRPGARLVLMPIQGRLAGTFICYEAAVGPHVRAFAKAGAEVFVNISNDGYFFRTQAREQHLQLARMRAVENRRWLLRSTNNGITVSIDPAGTVREQIAGFSVSSLRAGYGYVSGQTVFTAFGDWFLWLGALIVAVGLVASQWPHYLKPRVSR